MVGGSQLVVSGFDVDGSDVVGEEQNLARVDLVSVFALEIGGVDVTRLEEARDERAGARERVEDVDAFVLEGDAEVLG